MAAQVGVRIQPMNIVAIFFLLRADRRRSEKLYEDMIRRRRARRERSPEPA